MALRRAAARQALRPLGSAPPRRLASSALPKLLQDMLPKGDTEVFKKFAGQPQVIPAAEQRRLDDPTFPVSGWPSETPDFFLSLDRSTKAPALPQDQLKKLDSTWETWANANPLVQKFYSNAAGDFAKKPRISLQEIGEHAQKQCRLSADEIDATIQVTLEDLEANQKKYPDDPTWRADTRYYWKGDISSENVKDELGKLELWETYANAADGKANDPFDGGIPPELVTMKILG
eukprot:115115_1